MFSGDRHFYQGSCLLIHVIYPNGQYEQLKFGTRLERGESFQRMVPAGAWFASEPINDGKEFSLVVCTTAPGFDFADFELANENELAIQFPTLTTLIHRLCRKIDE